MSELYPDRNQRLLFAAPSRKVERDILFRDLYALVKKNSLCFEDRRFCMNLVLHKLREELNRSKKL